MAADVALVLGFGVVVAARIAVVAGVEALEVVRMLLVAAVSGIGAVIAVVRIEGAVDVAVETGFAVIPTACAAEVAAFEPFRTVVAVRSAAIGGEPVVAVRTGWFGADANADGNLGIRFRSGSEDEEREGRDQDVHELAHEVPQHV
jgi:hypothetical protein